MVFRDPEDLAALALTDSTALVLPEVLAWAPYAGLHGRRWITQALYLPLVRSSELSGLWVNWHFLGKKLSVLTATEGTPDW